MAPIPPGVYSISRPVDQLITFMEGVEKGSPGLLLPPTGNPGEQEWQVETLTNGNITIRNLLSHTYLSYDGDPRLNSPVGSFPEPREWALYQSSRPFTFHIVVPGGPIDGSELALDISLLRIFPPRLALRPLEVSAILQAWSFQFHE